MNTLQLREKIVKKLHDEYAGKKVILSLNQGTSSAVLLSMLSQAIGPKNISTYYFISKADDDIRPIIRLADKTGTKLTAITNLYADEVLHHHAEQEKAQILSPQDKTSILLEGKHNSAPAPLKELYRTQVFGLADLCAVPQELITKELNPDKSLPVTECSLTDYNLIDKVLKLHHENKQSKKEILRQGVPEQEYEKIISKTQKAEKGK